MIHSSDLNKQIIIKIGDTPVGAARSFDDEAMRLHRLVFDRISLLETCGAAELDTVSFDIEVSGETDVIYKACSLHSYANKTKADDYIIFDRAVVKCL